MTRSTGFTTVERSSTERAFGFFPAEGVVKTRAHDIAPAGAISSPGSAGNPFIVGVKTTGSFTQAPKKILTKDKTQALPKKHPPEAVFVAMHQLLSAHREHPSQGIGHRLLFESERHTVPDRTSTDTSQAPR